MIAKSSFFGRMLGPVIPHDVAEKIVAWRADEQTQARIDELADKSTEGLLTPEERAEYEAYVSEINFISLLQAKARRLLSRQS